MCQKWEKGGAGQEEAGQAPRVACLLECGCYFHFVNLKSHSPEKWDLFYLQSKFSM